MTPACRLCAASLGAPVADLGATPLANAFLRPDQLGCPEMYGIKT